MDAFLGLYKRNRLAGRGDDGAVSVAGGDSAAGRVLGEVQFVCGGVARYPAGAVPFGLVALAVAMSAVSLYYYLQVLKRVFVMPAVDETPLKCEPGDDGSACADCAGGGGSGVPAGVAADVDGGLLRGDVSHLTRFTDPLL